MSKAVSITIVFSGRIPSKKNCQRPLAKGGKIIIVTSKEYSEWERSAIADDLYGIQPITWPRFRCEMTIFAPDAGDADLSNKWEGLADSMVKAGILPDDNWWLLSEVTMRFGGIDREHPRAIVRIFEMDESISGDDEKIAARAKTAKRNSKKLQYSVSVSR
jgi:hypothetical protein